MFFDLLFQAGCSEILHIKDTHLRLNGAIQSADEKKVETMESRKQQKKIIKRKCIRH